MAAMYFRILCTNTLHNALLCHKKKKRNNFFFQSCQEGMQGYAIIGFFSIVEANKQASVILSRTVGIQEDQLKLNSKLAFPNYLQLKE